MAEAHVCDFSHITHFVPTEFMEFYVPINFSLGYEKFLVKSARFPCRDCGKISTLSKPPEPTGQYVSPFKFWQMKQVN